MAVTRSHAATNGSGKTSSATATENNTGEQGPIRFLKGPAISVWQNSGDPDSNWTRFAKSRWPFSFFGVSTIRGKYNIDTCSDFWNNYERDIKLSADVGSNTFRLSIEWARVEPERGVIDMQAVKRYHEIFDCLNKHRLVPNATMWHFVHPAWFDQLGGFTKEANIRYFVDFAVRCIKLFGSRCALWATFNEPSCAMFLGWICGIAPPGRTFDLVGAGQFLSTMLKAHTAAYRAVKALPEASHIQLGLVSHHITFEALGSGLVYGAAKLLADWMTYWWGWDVIEHWMLTGEFIWKLPVLGEWMRWKDPEGKPPCDWWGINYYSRGVFSWCLLPSCRPAEIMTDMYYPVYPEGMYRAIKRCSEFGVPIYITETGIADSRDDRRAIMIDAYFKEVLRALADGCDVRGFYYWTLLDNLEWATGYTMKFGLYAWEPDGSVDRKLKAGSRMLVDYFQKLPDDLDGVREAAQRAQRKLGADLGVEAELEGSGFTRVNKDGQLVVGDGDGIGIGGCKGDGRKGAMSPKARQRRKSSGNGQHQHEQHVSDGVGVVALG